MRGATRCYIGPSTSCDGGVPYGDDDMTDPAPFDDPGPLVPQPPGRARRIATVAILVLLIVSMVFLAFVSGRGLITPAPVAPDVPGPTLPEAGGSARPPGASPARLAIVDAAGRLTTSDPAGHASAPLGIAGVSYSFPAWSPEGDRIAVIGDDAGTGVVHVFGIGPDGSAPGGPIAVYDSVDRPPFYLSWSPDGTRLTFLTTEPDGGIALRVAPADASAPAQLVRQGAPMYWAWTGPSGLLVHSGGDAADAFIGEIGLDGVAVDPGVTGSGGFRAPAITADGAYRGFVATGGATADRVVAKSRNGSGRQGVDVDGAAAIDFSPTTPDLAFIAPNSPGPQVTLPVGPLRILSAATGAVRVVLAGPVVAFFWSPDGRTLAALQVGQPSDDNIAGLDDATARLARAPMAVPAPGVPLRLVFVDATTGIIHAKRGIQLADLFAAQQLPYFDQYALSHRLWSPDSRSIALPVDSPDGKSGIEVFPADGSDATRVADGVAAAWSP